MAIFRDFNDKPSSASPSLMILLLGTAMFGGMVWMLHWVLHSPAMDYGQLFSQ
ncbi:MAG: hypothetical protein WC829_09680 [Hyphomicrobium sp.]|jgi:hypothetical protein